MIFIELNEWMFDDFSRFESNAFKKKLEKMCTLESNVWIQCLGNTPEQHRASMRCALSDCYNVTVHFLDEDFVGTVCFPLYTLHASSETLHCISQTV